MSKFAIWYGLTEGCTDGRIINVENLSFFKKSKTANI